MSTRILVLGSGDVGSAVAHRLFLHGLDVVLADAPAPAHPRRGMAFTDAWFDDAASLKGVVARFVANAEDLKRQLATMDVVPCTAEAVETVSRPDESWAALKARQLCTIAPACLLSINRPKPGSRSGRRSQHSGSSRRRAVAQPAPTLRARRGQPSPRR